MSAAAQGPDQWMPNGFPPPSFVVETERTSTFAGARGRWLAAAAILGALLLIAGVLLIAGQDDGKTALTAGTTTTAFGDTTPTSPTSVLDPAASLPAATTLPGGDPGTTIAGGVTTPTTSGGGGGTGTTAAPPPATSGTLADNSTLAIPKFDSAAGPGRAALVLKNTGNGSLAFTSQSNFTGLTVTPATGNIGAGAQVEVVVALNGAAAAEGPFSGVVSFGGTGGTQRVTVTSEVARLPVLTENADAVRQCPAENAPAPAVPCSKLIDTLAEEPGAGPCTKPWVFKVNVSDESGLNSVIATLNNTPLKTGNPASPSGPSGVWQSDQQTPLAAGEHKFTIEAIDRFGNSRRTNERRIVCPAPAPQG